MVDFLDVLARDAEETINGGYYEISTQTSFPSLSLKEAILESKKIPIITEIKAASPSLGAIRTKIDLAEVARSMERSGAVGISVLTEPKHFKGSLGSVSKVREAVKLPALMKNIIISPIQLEAASKIGANAVLLIQALFDRGYCKKDVQWMIDYSHSRGLEVLLEVHNEDEFISSLEIDADMIGINNRDLKTLEVDLETTKRILAKHNAEEKVIVSESGINVPADIRFLRRFGAQAFLVGTAIMSADNIERKVRELVEAL